MIVNSFLLLYSCDKTKQARRVPREFVSNKKFVEKEDCAMYLSMFPKGQMFLISETSPRARRRC